MPTVCGPPALAEGVAIALQRAAGVGGVLDGLQVGAGGVDVQPALVGAHACPHLLLGGAGLGGGPHAESGHRRAAAEALRPRADRSSGRARRRGRAAPRARRGAAAARRRAACGSACRRSVSRPPAAGPSLAVIARHDHGHAARAALAQLERARLQRLVQGHVVRPVTSRARPPPGRRSARGKCSRGGRRCGAPRRSARWTAPAAGEWARRGGAAAAPRRAPKVDGAGARGGCRERQRESQREQRTAHRPHPLHLPKNLRTSSAVIVSLPSLPTTRALPSMTMVTASPRVRQSFRSGRASSRAK